MTDTMRYNGLEYRVGKRTLDDRYSYTTHCLDCQGTRQGVCDLNSNRAEQICEGKLVMGLCLESNHQGRLFSYWNFPEEATEEPEPKFGYAESNRMSQIRQYKKDIAIYERREKEELKYADGAMYEAGRLERQAEAMRVQGYRHDQKAKNAAVMVRRATEELHREEAALAAQEEV